MKSLLSSEMSVCQNLMLSGTYYNFLCANYVSTYMLTSVSMLRPHQALDGKTPAEMANIDLNLEGNRWENLIKKATNR